MKEFDFDKVPIVEIANEILLDGVKRGASDIHFDPYKDGLAVRMRVDGVLYDYATVPEGYKRNMISRIKMIASMNIMETRLPQDGAIKSKIGDKTLDLRVSSLPTHNGEKVVLRILDYSKSLQGLETLGFSEHNLEKIIKMIEIPNGIVLVTGATGSGKSTTVYSILQKLNTREVNIITVEDPVEMEVEGLNQVQAQQEIGLDFATVLRSILRQDPDIIMIGEIRDSETARIAVRASITGHKVLSTIHTNNALNTIERLTDMDVERYLIGTSLNGVISQKLARKLCPHCRVARQTNDYEKSLFQRVLHKEVDKVYDVNPEGCEHCFRGYKDRLAIAEVLVITDDIRNAITNSAPKSEMRRLVYYEGHTHTLLEDGLEKIYLGETNFEEIFKLVDLENDLAVHDSFNKELEDELNEYEDDLYESDQAQEDEIEDVIKANQSRKEAELAYSLDDDEFVDSTKDTSPKEEKETPKVESTPISEIWTDQKPVQTPEIETPKTEEVVKPPEIIQEIDTPEILTPPTVEIPEIVDDKPKVEEPKLFEDFEVLDNLDEPKEEVKPLETSQTTPLTAEPILDDSLKILDNLKEENKDNEEISNLSEPSTIDPKINNDQIMGVPFVDETLDL